MVSTPLRAEEAGLQLRKFAPAIRHATGKLTGVLAAAVLLSGLMCAQPPAQRVVVRGGEAGLNRTVQSVFAETGAEVVLAADAGEARGADVVVDLSRAAIQSGASELRYAHRLLDELLATTALQPIPRSASAASMTKPDAGSMLAGADVLFEWTAGEDVTNYWLFVGQWPGGDTLYNADQGTLRSTAVKGLPVDGRLLYVRLWSLIGGQWQYRDYQYRANIPGGGGPEKAQMLAPVPGGPLPGTTVKFEWSRGVAVTNYFLFVGLWPGGDTLYAKDTGEAASAVVENLPGDGKPVCVRLWSYLDSAWTYTDYAYRAYNQNGLQPEPAVMLKPVPESTLPGASARFEWSEGWGVTGYWLSVGNTVGDGSIYYAWQGTALSTVVNNLPADGRLLYVRLWSLINGVWQSRDFRYAAAKP